MRAGANARLVADARKAFPGASVHQDGANYIVVLPSHNGMPAYRYVFDVRTGTMRPL